MSPRFATPLSLRSSLLLATTLVALLVLPACPGNGGEAKASRGMELALQDDAVFVNPTYFDRERAFKHLRSLGVTRLRVSLGWANAMPQSQAKKKTKPAKIEWYFGLYDNLIDAAADQGIRVQLSISGPAPAWATGNHKKGPVRPSASKFGEFAKLAAEHFAGRVDRYSVWNEPNWKSWLNPPSGNLYRSLYLKAYAAVRKADPDAKILIGETSPYARKGLSVAPLAFLREMGCVNKKYKRTRSCPKLQADGYAHHPYDFYHAPNFKYPGADNATLGTLSNLTRGLDKLSRAGSLRKTGGGKLPLYLTEFGYFASGHRALSASKRSKYLPQAFDIALKNKRVKSFLQYLLVTPPKRFDFAFFNTALITSTNKTYPQYRSLKRWYGRNKSRVKRPTTNPVKLPAARVVP